MEYISSSISSSCSLLLLFIRTGNWDLHLYAVYEMIPILHAATHLAINAKSARLYLDTMTKLPEIMP